MKTFNQHTHTDETLEDVANDNKLHTCSSVRMHVLGLWSVSILHLTNSTFVSWMTRKGKKVKFLDSWFLFLLPCKQRECKLFCQILHWEIICHFLPVAMRMLCRRQTFTSCSLRLSAASASQCVLSSVVPFIETVLVQNLFFVLLSLIIIIIG